MNKIEKIIIISVVTMSVISSFSVGTIYGTYHIDYDDPDWECKKWVGIVELAKQDYPYLIEDALTLAEMKCGFDVDELTITQENDNSELELRLQSEIDSNQKMSQLVNDVIMACNEKLFDKHNSSEEKLKKENEILQKALTALRET